MLKKLIAFVALFALVCTVTASDDPSVSIPGVVDITPSNVDSILDGSKHVLVEFYAPWCGYCKRLVPDYTKLGETVQAANLKDVVVAKCDANEYKELGSRFSVSGFPTIKFFPKGSTTPEDYAGGRTAEDFIEFLNNKAGARIKIKKDPSFVTDLDESNFDKVVMDKSKNVLVEFYAPWCGHCKQLAPEYEKVAAAFKSESNVVIAKIDSDKFKEPGSRYGVSGFPTIKFFPAGDKTPVDFSGPRNLDGIVSYVNEKAGTSRLSSGKLSEKAGRFEDLDALVATFVAASDNDAKKKVVAEAKTLAGSEKNKQYYIRVMEKVLEKGAGYPEQEKTRLSKMVESQGANLVGAKLDDMQTRINVLSAF